MMPSTLSSRHCCHREQRPRDRRRRRRRHAASSEALRRVGGGRSTGTLCVVAGVVLCCSALLLVPVAEGMAKNEEKDSNDLGLLAQACAASYCGVGMTALDLWLSLEEKCDVESTPSLIRLWANGGSGTFTDLSGNWSPTSAALVCACVGSMLAYAGFRSGVRVGTQTKGGYPVA